MMPTCFLSIPAEFVAQFKHTAILMPNGLVILTGYPFDASVYESEYSIPDGELKELVTAELKLAETIAPPKEKKKKPKKGKENKAEGGDASAADSPAAEAKA